MHARAHLFERRQRHHLQVRLGLLAAGGFEAHVHDAQHAVEDALHGIDVLDAAVGHMPLVLGQQAAADDQLVVQQVVAEDQGAGDRDQRERHEQDHGVGLPGV